MGFSLISKYFPELSEGKADKLMALKSLYEDWNEKINVISRKDMEHLYERHVLHSLGIAKVVKFKPVQRVIDIGTGGGFPGIPLAILYPDVHFHLVDSTGKKIKVVNAIKEALFLDNVVAEHKRGEEVRGKYDHVITRATMKMHPFYKKFRHLLSPGKSKVIALKGGDLKEELKHLKAKQINLKRYFDEEFFQTKKVVIIKAE